MQPLISMALVVSMPRKTLSDLPNDILLMAIPNIPLERNSYVALSLTNLRFHGLLTNYQSTLTQTIAKEQFPVAAAVSRNNICSITQLRQVRLQTSTVDSIVRCYRDSPADSVESLTEANNLQIFVVGLHLWATLSERWKSNGIAKDWNWPDMQELRMEFD
jgi:hypothetical protein